MISIALIGLELILYALTFIWLGVLLDHWFLWNSWGRTGYLVASTVGYLLVFIVRIRVHGPIQSKRRADGVVGQMLLMVVAIVVACSPFLFLDHIAGRLERFGDHRKAHPSTSRFTIVIPTTARVIERGTPLTLTAYADTEEGTTVPTMATLLLRESESVTRQPMRFVGNGVFDVTLPPIERSFSYAVEIDSKLSDWHAITVTERFAILPDSTLTIVPPDYANATLPDRRQPDLQQVTALAGSRLRLQWHLNQKIARAWLQWNDADPSGIPVSIVLNKSTIDATVPLQQSGRLMVNMANAEGLTKSSTIDITVVEDSPPTWSRVDGLVALPCPVTVGAVIPIDATVEDDVGIRRLGLEYRFSEMSSAIRRVNVSLTNGSPRVGTIQAQLRVGDLAAVGDTLQIRLHAEDYGIANKPTSHFFPESGWATLHVVAEAPPYEQTVIAALEKRTATALERVIRNIDDARQELGPFLSTKSMNFGANEQQTRIDNSFAELQSAAQTLTQLAGELNLKPAFRLIAEQLSMLQHDGLVPIAERLQRLKLQQETITAGQLRPLDSDLLGVTTRLLGLVSLNASHAQHRRDILKIQALLAELRTGQSIEVVRLLQLIESSPELRKNVLAAANNRRRQLLLQQRNLAQHLSALAEAITQTQRRSRVQRSAALLQKQRAWNDALEAQLHVWELPLRLADTRGLRVEFLTAAQTALANGQPSEAATNQQQIALELDRLALGMAHASVSDASLQEWLAMLAAWQGDLAQRWADQAPHTQPNIDNKPLHVEQDPLMAMLHHMAQTVPALHDEPRFKKCRELARRAVAQLESGSGDGIETMRQSAAQLREFAKLAPSPRQLAETRIKQLQQWQDNVLAESKLIENRLETPEQRINPESIHSLTEELRRIDLDEFPAARYRAFHALESLQKAIETRHDVETMLRVLEQRTADLLQQAEGQPSASAVCQRLAQELAAIAQALTKPSTFPKTEQLKEWTKRLTQCQADLAAIRSPEYALVQHNCMESILECIRSLQQKKQINVVTLRANLQESVARLNNLAHCFAGSCSPLTRLHNLKRRQADWLEAVRLRNGLPSDRQTVTDIVVEINAMIAELRHCPVGSATRQKQQTIDALQTLSREPQLDIEPRLHVLAGQAFDALLDRVDQTKSLEFGTAWVGPPMPSLSQRLQSMPGIAALPNDAHVMEIQCWSRESRLLRDATTRQLAAVQAKLIPAPTDPLGELLHCQQKLTRQIEQETIGLIQSNRQQSLMDAIESFTLALEVGQRTRAIALAEILTPQFARLAIASPRWAALAEEQRLLIAQLKALPDDPALELARQQNALQSLHIEAEELARTSATLIPAWPTAEPMTGLATLAQRHARIVDDLKTFAKPLTPDTAVKLRDWAELLATPQPPETRTPERAGNHPLLDAIEWTRRGNQSSPSEPIDRAKIHARVSEALERFLARP